jgi:capsular exopolysaccharide synthesis family protein
MLSMDEIVEQGQGQRLGPIFWAEKWVILISVAVVVGLAILYTLSEAKVYQATAVLQVNIATSNPGSADTTASNQGLAQNYATLLVSPGLLNTIRGRVDGGRLGVAALQSRLTATALPNTALVQLQATGPTPVDAQHLAQQVITGFLSELQYSASSRTTELQAQDAQTTAALSAQITRLQSQRSTPALAQQIRSLQTSRQTLIAQNAVLIASGLADGTSATLAAAPVASSSPISPKKSLNLIAGLVLGLVLGIALAWIHHLLRPTLRSADEAAAAIDVPILASIPLKPRLVDIDPAVAEAYRILATNLSFATSLASTAVITIVGYNPQVGKTSVVLGIAEATATPSREVLIIDSDMRAATLSRRLSLQHRPGIVDVLQGVIDPESAVVRIAEGLSLLPARPSRINAATLLAGGTMQSLIPELRERYDLVLFDSPPISGLADGLILASMSDFAVLVARAGITKRDDLRAAASSLNQSFTPVAGLVMFEEKTSDPYYPAWIEQNEAGRRGSRFRATAS